VLTDRGTWPGRKQMQLQLPQKNKEGSKNPIAHISSSRSAHVYVRLCLCDFAGGSISL